jgi:hypothetical protein
LEGIKKRTFESSPHSNDMNEFDIDESLSLPVDQMKKVYDEFIAPNALRQVNISSEHLSNVEIALTTALSENRTEMDSNAFDSCLKEIIGRSNCKNIQVYIWRNS